MAKFNVNWNRVINIIEVCAKVLRTIILVIAAIVLTCILWGLAFPIMWIVMFNPVMFYLWSLVWPRRAASAFYDVDNEDENNPLDAWATLMIAIFMWLCRKSLRWEINLLPWYAKKHFINEEPTDYNVTEVVRYFRTLPENEKTGFMTNFIPASNDKDEAKIAKDDLYEDLWSMRDMWINKALLAAKNLMRKAFTKDEMQYICDTNDVNTLDKYLKWATLSEEHLQKMMKSTNVEILARVEEHIKRNGVSPDFIAWAYENNANVELLSKNLDIYSQIIMVRRHQRTADDQIVKSWRKYCAGTPEIYSEAQMEFSSVQTKIFYETSHNEMSEEAVFHFFSETIKEKSDVAKVIIENEGEKALKSERIKLLVKSNFVLNSQVLFQQGLLTKCELS